MTVTFVTRRQDHKVSHQLIKVLHPSQVDLFQVLLNKSSTNSTEDTQTSKGWYLLGHDIENRSTEPCRASLLLSAFCNYDDEVLVIDNTSVDNTELFTPQILSRCAFVAHNADHESMWGIATGFVPMRYYCTMVNSKRLLAGETGYRFDLISEINRRLGYKAIPIWMDKDIRSTFNDCQYFINEQILYNAADAIRLKAILAEQYRIAKERGQFYLLNSLNSRVIKPIAETEVRGIRHNTEKWIGIAKDRQQRAEVIWQELNQILNQKGIDLGLINPEIRKQRESQSKKLLKNQERKLKLEAQLKQLEEKGKQHLKSYKVIREQLTLMSTTQGLAKEEDGSGSINWGSPKQVLEVLNQLGCPVPVAKDKKTHQMKPSLGKEGRANWFIAHENSVYEPFMKKFDAQKKLIHNVNSFGEEWIKKYVRNGRAYTRINQAGTATGRFTSGSGGKSKTYANMSQIPKPVEYRECFMADDGRLIFTVDYRNQEGVIIISLSADMEMKKITEAEDQHSLLGTRAWRAVYRHRYNKTNNPKWLELATTYEMNKSTPEKSKERDKFKNSAGLFPVLYGCTANKVAATAQVTVEEGQVMIDVIKACAPQATLFLDSKAKEASTNGYVIHNTRANSRRAFSKVLDHIHYGFPISKSELIDAEMEGRNTAIQGTGANIIQEAIAMIALWNSLYKQDIQFVLSNYDEYVASFPKDKAEQYSKVVSHFMKKAASNYLIKEIQMEVESNLKETWTK